MSRQMFGHLQESRAPSFTGVTCEDKHHHPKCPSLLPSSSSSCRCWVWNHMIQNIALVTGVSNPIFVPSLTLLPFLFQKTPLTTWTTCLTYTTAELTIHFCLQRELMCRLPWMCSLNSCVWLDEFHALWHLGLFFQIYLQTRSQVQGIANVTDTK